MPGVRGELLDQLRHHWCPADRLQRLRRRLLQPLQHWVWPDPADGLYGQGRRHAVHVLCRLQRRQRADLPGRPGYVHRLRCGKVRHRRPVVPRVPCRHLVRPGPCGPLHFCHMRRPVPGGQVLVRGRVPGRGRLGRKRRRLLGVPRRHIRRLGGHGHLLSVPRRLVLDGRGQHGPLGLHHLRAGLLGPRRRRGQRTRHVHGLRGRHVLGRRRRDRNHNLHGLPYWHLHDGHGPDGALGVLNLRSRLLRPYLEPRARHGELHGLPSRQVLGRRRRHLERHVCVLRAGLCGTGELRELRPVCRWVLCVVRRGQREHEWSPHERRLWCHRLQAVPDRLLQRGAWVVVRMHRLRRRVYHVREGAAKLYLRGPAHNLADFVDRRDVPVQCELLLERLPHVQSGLLPEAGVLGLCRGHVYGLDPPFLRLQRPARLVRLGLFVMHLRRRLRAVVPHDDGPVLGRDELDERAQADGRRGLRAVRGSAHVG